jgi:hypothetical protein
LDASEIMSTSKRAEMSPHTTRLLRFSSLALLSLGACDANHAEEPRADELPQIEGVSQIVTVPDPSGSYFAEVKANGTGCPPGTWNTRISNDGQAFTTTFSSYVTQVDPSVPLSIRDCQLAIKLHTPNGRSFSVQSFYYSGYALLQPGVTGRQMASYYFQGQSVPPAESNRTDLNGPYDNSYLFRDDIPISGRAWSPCGVERDLIIQTRVQLNNGERRSGYMNLSAADGSGKLVVSLQSRQCDGGKEEPPPTPSTLSKPTGVALQPATVQTGQPFTISWQPLGGRPNATYQVQVQSTPNGAVVWESPQIGGRGLTYNGPVLKEGGTYQVVVIVRDGNLRATSDPVALTVGTPVASLPVWARPLLGRYAMRIDSFTGTAIGLTTTNEAISIAEFTMENGELIFREESCSQTAKAFGVNLALRSPEAYPLVRRKVTLGDSSRWSTDDEPIGVGYERNGIPACAGRIGQSIPKRPFQTWIRGSECRCRDVESAPLLDDCRVTDPDQDGFPGVAFKWGGSSATDSWVSHTSVVARTHFLRGRVDPNGAHSAAVKIDETSFQYTCEPSSRCGVSFASYPCTSDYNSVKFVRLPDPPSGQRAWTCSSLLANRTRFFSRSSPSAPTFCSKETPTDAQ